VRYERHDITIAVFGCHCRCTMAVKEKRRILVTQDEFTRPLQTACSSTNARTRRLPRASERG